MSVHVQFTRSCDAGSALAELHGVSRAPTRHDDELEFDCAPEEEDVVIVEVSHALDDWLEQHELPFTAEQMDAHTLVVRPPAG